MKLGGVAACVALLVACGSNSPDLAPPPPRVIDATKDAAIPDMKEGRDYRVTRVIEVPNGAYHYESIGSVRKGLEFGVLSPDWDQPAPAETRAWQSVALVELDHGRVPPLDSVKVKILKHPEAPEREGQLWGVVRSGDQLVWLTDAGNGQCLGCNWELYAADLKTSRVRRLASHREVDDPGPSGPSRDFGQQVVDGRVYLTIDHPSGWTGRPPSAYSVPLDGAGKLRRVIPGAQAVFADGHYLRFVDRKDQLLRWDPKSKKVSRAGVAAVTSPNGAFFHEGVAVQGDGKRLIITEVGRRTTVLNVGTAKFGGLAATSRWVGFKTRHSSLIYDLRRKKLLRLGGTNSLWWQPYNGNRLIHVRARIGHPKAAESIALLP